MLFCNKNACKNIAKISLYLVFSHKKYLRTCDVRVPFQHCCSDISPELSVVLLPSMNFLCFL